MQLLGKSMFNLLETAKFFSVVALLLGIVTVFSLDCSGRDGQGREDKRGKEEKEETVMNWSL